jgi:transcription initiation factor TFIIIB Brf1 subunit/transcription initiation factor TFIIB
MGSVKVWQFHEDKVLSMLCGWLVNRKLFKIQISKEAFSEERMNYERELAKSTYGLTDEEVNYFIYTDHLTNNAYNEKRENINLLLKSGEVIDVSKAADNLNISALSTPVEKFYLCYPVHLK